MKKIPHFDTLIFGSNSFSGKHLLFFFKKKKIDVLGIYRNKKIKYKKFNQKKIDLTNKIQFKVKSNNLIIISSVHKIEDFNIDKKKNYKNNILIVKNSLDFAKKNNIKNIIFFSTIDINFIKWPKLKKDYIPSKVKGEEILHNSYKKGELKKLFFLRLPAIIGKNCNKNFLVNLIANLKANNKVTLWNYNKPYNNFIHIDDVCRLVYKLLKLRKNRFKIIECESYGSKTLLSMAKYAKKKLNSKSIMSLKTNNKNKKIKYYKKISNFKFQKNFSTFKKFLNEAY